MVNRNVLGVKEGLAVRKATGMELDRPRGKRSHPIQLSKRGGLKGLEKGSGEETKTAFLAFFVKDFPYLFRNTQ